MKKLNQEDWSPYWKNSTITSFGDLFPNNYDGSILDFWREQLAGEINFVADLACGNGALTWIANEILNRDGRRVNITGVDFANIDPFAILARSPEDYPAVTFVGNTFLEDLPFETSSIDLVVSQYGIEYSNLKKSVPEVARVLRPGGKMAFIMHDKESVVIKGATEHLADFNVALNEIRMHEYALELDKLHLRFTSPQQRSLSNEVQALSNKISRAVLTINSMLSRHPPNSPLATYISRLNQAFTKAPGTAKMNRREQILAASDKLHRHIARVEDLSGAALSETGLAALVGLIEHEGFRISLCETLPYKEHANIGTRLVAER